MKKIPPILLLVLCAGVSLAATSELIIDTKTKALTTKDGGTIIDAKNVSLTLGGFTISDASGVKTIVLGATSGTKVGATGNKIGFLGATPVVRPTGNIFTALTALGLVDTPSILFSNLTGVATSDQIPALSADKITTGTLGVARIPALDASKTTTGSFHADRIPSLDWAKITTGKPTSLAGYGIILPASDVPALDAAKITTGSFDTARIPSLDAAKVTTGSFDVARIPSLDFSKISTGIVPKLQLPAVTAYSDAANIFTQPNTFEITYARSLVLNELVHPEAPEVVSVGSVGVSTWSYKVVGRLSDGTTTTAASNAGTLASGFPTLSVTNYNAISWDAITGAVSYDLYRTAVGTSPATTGRIATGLTAPSFNDQGAVGDGSTAPVFNETGMITAAANGTERIFLYEPGGDLDHARFNEPIKIDLSNPANNFKQGLNITAITNSSVGTIRTSGIAIYAYTPPDNGGDASGIFAQQTGGGNAISAFNFSSNRPAGFTEYANDGNAIEASVDGGKHSILSKAENGFAFFGLNSGTGGSFLAKPTAGAENRRAYSAQNAAGTENFYVNYSGDALIAGDAHLKGDLALDGTFVGGNATFFVPGNPILQLKTSNGNAAARNWSISANDVAWGDLTIRQSTTLGGDATVGPVRLSLSPAGDLAVAGLSVTGPVVLPAASIADEALSANVPRLDAGNTFTALQTITSALDNPLIVRSTTAIGYAGIQVRNDQNNIARAVELGYTGSLYHAGELGYVQSTGGAYPLVLNAGGVLTAGLRLFPSHGAYLGSSAPTDPGDGVISINQARLRSRTVPGSPVAGEIYFSSADSRFYGFNGTVWKQLDN